MGQYFFILQQEKYPLSKKAAFCFNMSKKRLYTAFTYCVLKLSAHKKQEAALLRQPHPILREYNEELKEPIFYPLTETTTAGRVKSSCTSGSRKAIVACRRNAVGFDICASLCSGGQSGGSIRREKCGLARGQNSKNGGAKQVHSGHFPALSVVNHSVRCN